MSDLGSRESNARDVLDTIQPDAIQDEKRRDLFKTALIATTAGGLALSGLSQQASAAVTSQERSGKSFKVIDWRNRPPLKPYAGLFNLRLNFIAGRPNTLANPATHGSLPEVINMVEKPGGMEAWWEENDKAGVDIAIANGRYAAGLADFSMDNKTLIDLQKKYPGRFLGLAALNLDQPMVDTVAELEDAIANGIRGGNIEPGYRTKNGGATTIENQDFYPIFETMSDNGLPLMVQTGAFAGLYDWNEANQIWRFDNLMSKFPKLRLVLAHGGYPSIQETLGLALKHPSVSICPDVYTFWPGGQLYQQNIEMLQDQFIYGSAFPFGNIGTTLEQTLALPISDTVMEKYLYGNAKALLKL